MKRSWWYGVMWSVWLSYWLGNLGCNFSQLKFWYIWLPIVILANMEANARKNNQ